MPRFKPPRMTNHAAPPTACPRTKDGAAAVTRDGNGERTWGSLAEADPDSSFDVSFDMDIDALEEAMRPYD